MFIVRFPLLDGYKDCRLPLTTYHITVKNWLTKVIVKFFKKGVEQELRYPKDYSSRKF
jgi:hypothetical protein